MNSKSLELYLLNKYEVDKIEDIDLDKIEELCLNNINGNDIQDYNFKDFEKLNNLKYISLQNFKIKNFETNELNRCKNLSAIQFSNCKFKSKSRLRGNIQLISFNNCTGVKIKYISALKKLEILKIMNLKKINLNHINFYIKSLEKVYFENTRIYNFVSLSKLKKLISVELVNCKWNRNAKKLFSEEIQIKE